MADIYGAHFEYDGVTSRLYNLIIANVGTKRNVKAAGDISGITIFNKASKNRVLIGDDYRDSPVSFDVDIVTDHDGCIDKNERRKIEKWLFNKSGYKKFYIDIDDDCKGESYERIDGFIKRLYLKCRFINPKKLEYNGGIVGYTATLEADSGYWWQDTVTKTVTPITGAPFNIYTDTDIDDYIYPKVTINIGNIGGAISIKNNTDDPARVFSFTNLPANISIVADGNSNYIAGYFGSRSGRSIDLNTKMLKAIRGEAEFNAITYGTVEFDAERFVVDSSIEYTEDSDWKTIGVVIPVGYKLADPQPTSSNFANGEYYISRYSDSVIRFVQASSFSETEVYYTLPTGRKLTALITPVKEDYTDILENESETYVEAICKYTSSLNTDGNIKDVLSSDDNHLIIHIVEDVFNASYWNSFNERITDIFLYYYAVMIEVLLELGIDYAEFEGLTETYKVMNDIITETNARNFPRLLDGNNKIETTGNIASITFEYNNRRML